jgi:hypothetical protein
VPFLNSLKTSEDEGARLSFEEFADDIAVFVMTG